MCAGRIAADVPLPLPAQIELRKKAGTSTGLDTPETPLAPDLYTILQQKEARVAGSAIMVREVCAAPPGRVGLTVRHRQGSSHGYVLPGASGTASVVEGAASAIVRPDVAAAGPAAAGAPATLPSRRCAVLCCVVCVCVFVCVTRVARRAAAAESSKRKASDAAGNKAKKPKDFKF